MKNMMPKILSFTVKTGLRQREVFGLKWEDVDFKNSCVFIRRSLAHARKESVPEAVVTHALEGKIIPLVNAEILEEYNDMLRRKKFKFDEQAVEVIIAGIISRAIHVDAVKTEEFFPNPKDAVFYQ